MVKWFNGKNKSSHIITFEIIVLTIAENSNLAGGETG